MGKVCNVCKEEKDFEEFPKRSDRKSGCYGYCKICYNARKKRERAAKASEYRETRIAWIESNRDKCREADRKWYYNNQQKSIDNKKRWSDANPKKRLVKNAKYRAKELGIEFNITCKDIIISSSCPVLGISLNTTPNMQTRDNSPSIDRIDNSKGYIKGNVAVISYRANRLKRDATIKELEDIIEYMKAQA